LESDIEGPMAPESRKQHTRKGNGGDLIR